MENKNFEKINAYEKGCSYAFADGYNTCLDRTNVKGIYEKVKKLDKKYYDRLDECDQVVLIPISEWQELQTELKKAE